MRVFRDALTVISLAQPHVEQFDRRDDVKRPWPVLPQLPLGRRRTAAAKKKWAKKGQAPAPSNQFATVAKVNGQHQHSLSFPFHIY
jgi:hypothetical protein